MAAGVDGVVPVAVKVMGPGSSGRRGEIGLTFVRQRSNAAACGWRHSVAADGSPRFGDAVVGPQIDSLT
jgi:hypothetical protein